MLQIKMFSKLTRDDLDPVNEFLEKAGKDFNILQVMYVNQVSFHWDLAILYETIETMETPIRTIQELRTYRNKQTKIKVFANVTDNDVAAVNRFLEGAGKDFKVIQITHVNHRSYRWDLAILYETIPTNQPNQSN